MSLELLDLAKIAPYVSSSNQAYLTHAIILPEISSTNTYLLQAAKKQNNETYLCLAESQTHGRGRLERKWFSPFASNIYLSLLWSFTKPAHELSGLSLAIAIAIVNALQRYGIKQSLALKWPNDVFWQKRKLAGVLIEIANNKPSPSQVVIGVGLNVTMPNAAQTSIDQPWVDLAEIINPATPQRNQIAGLLIDELLNTCTIFNKEGFGAFQEKWQLLDLYHNQTIKISTPSGPISGISRGINSFGQLLLETDNGIIKTFSNGEILASHH
jgi:BirA family transcriptional regulator, biotin operon repressor / biotin---[acetyl-CoA-carboxylase] ligase